MGRVIVAPSILAADFTRLGEEIRRVEAGGADWIHCDIMDGHFVDNISFGPEIVELVRGLTSLPLDVHLMIEHADHYVPRFIKAGANSITVHVEPEAKHSVAKTLQQIREAGRRAGQGFGFGLGPGLGSLGGHQLGLGRGETAEGYRG